jgi:hypothetical protein
LAKFPEFLYKLTARDMQVTPLEIVIVTANNSAPATNIQTQLYTVPKGKILLLDTVSFFEVAGAAQKFLNGRISVTGQNGSTIIAGRSAASATAGIPYADSVEFNSVAIGEGNIITVTNIFDSGVASNSSTNGLTGILIPRGNFAI